MSSKKTVLVVDDDQALCVALEAKFSKHGYDVTVVHDGEEATKQLKENVFTVVMLDLHMPHKDGFEVLRDMKETKNKDTPVYVVTNLGEEDYCDKALELGAKKCYIKSLVTLKEIVEEVHAEISK